MRCYQVFSARFIQRKWQQSATMGIDQLCQNNDSGHDQLNTHIYPIIYVCVFNMCLHIVRICCSTGKHIEIQCACCHGIGKRISHVHPPTLPCCANFFQVRLALVPRAMPLIANQPLVGYVLLVMGPTCWSSTCWLFQIFLFIKHVCLRRFVEMTLSCTCINLWHLQKCGAKVVDLWWIKRRYIIVLSARFFLVSRLSLCYITIVVGYHWLDHIVKRTSMNCCSKKSCCSTDYCRQTMQPPSIWWTIKHHQTSSSTIISDINTPIDINIQHQCESTTTVCYPGPDINH